MDVDQICTSILLGRKENWLDFDDLDPFWSSHEGLDCWNRLIFCTLSPKWMDRFRPNLYIYITKTCKKYWFDFGDLDSIFKCHTKAQIVGKWLACTLCPGEMGGFWHNLHSYRKNYMLVTFASFSRSCEGSNWMKMVCLHPVSWNVWLDFYKTCTAVVLRQGQELIRLCCPWPHC